MPVDTPCAEYAEALPKWQKMRDCFAGRDAILKAGEKYLPKLPGGKPEAYEAYKARASFFNAVRRTVQGLVGLIFQSAPEVEDAEPISEILDDVTPRGHVPFEQFAQSTTRELMTVGRVAALVDMPTGGEQPRPYAAMYKAEDLKSWRTGTRGANEILTRAVFRESKDVPDPKDEFVSACSDRYRVLELVDGIYQQAIWDRDDPGKKWQKVQTLIPVRRKQPLDFIPLVIMGPTGVGPDVEPPPCEDMADVNLGHYRNSADYEQGLHLVALPTPWCAGQKGNGADPLPIGPSVVWDLSENGKAGMLEFTGAGLAAIKDAMEEKKAQMATLGARLLEQQSAVAETASAVRMRHSGEHATLRTIAQSVEMGLTQVLQWLEWWDGTVETPADARAKCELNKEFFSVRATADEVRALMLMYQADGISFATFYDGIQKGGWAREGVSAEQEQKEIATQSVPRPAIEPGKSPNPNDPVPPPAPGQAVPPPEAPKPPVPEGAVA